MRYILLLSIILFSNLITAQSFCDGWKNGFTDGKASLNDNTFIIPICPIPPLNGDNYDNGYTKGFNKATRGTSAAIPTSRTRNSYCDGWKIGYKTAMSDYSQTTYIIPICPVAAMNGDNFDAGYALAYSTALKKLGKKSRGVTVQQDNTKTFCEGWKRGFKLGLSEWADENNRITPNRLTPICPIPGINKDKYQNGFDRGRAKAFEVMEM